MTVRQTKYWHGACCLITLDAPQTRTTGNLEVGGMLTMAADDGGGVAPAHSLPSRPPTSGWVHA
ncbi:hypothetical protein J7E70_29955 [Variovorax paradoxus]|nr:hypothetical protein [Variovorax paradoxus]MBT2304648.1 hypothetical protein [Variovorax paradoxus]